MISKFEGFNGKKVIFFHGLGGKPNETIKKVLEHFGYNVKFPHIDYYDEWDYDECKSLFEESIYLAKDCDLVIGLSLGGYLAYLVANHLGNDCILINPGIDRSKTKLEIKEFDCPKSMNNCNLEVFLGDKDDLIPNEYTINYLKDNNIKSKIHIVKGMEHGFDLNEFIDILKSSNLINK